MYILFEKSNAQAYSDDLSEYDAMGYADTEQDAQKWVEDNPEWRAYKYCPKKQITY